MTKPRLPSYVNFDNKNYAWKAGIDYRKNPERYKVGKGEQGVLICEPYKGEILKYWRFKTEAEALKSSKKIFAMFKTYLKNKEFVGADMARKFLQMGYTRSKRYANYKGGKKYNPEDNYTLLEKGTGDKEKLKSAAIFYAAWKKAETEAAYATLKQAWRKQYG
jgi:Domain of unknown function (DUF4385)